MSKNLEGDNDFFLEKSAPLIGNIVLNFNTLDSALTEMICEIISDRGDDQGLIITHKMHFSNKIDFFDRYSQWLQNTTGKIISTHKELVLNLKKCSSLRNMVIHADWESSFVDGYTLVKVIIDSKGIQQEYVQFSISSLEEIIKLIKSTVEMIDQYDLEFHN